MDNRQNQIAQEFLHLVEIMSRLRAPDGCPWDREQTHEKLKKYMIEEAYELLDSIDAGDDAEMAEELGDVMLQVIFHSQIAAEAERFDILDVLNAVCDKLVRRHPHVFGDRTTNTAEEVLRNWEVDKRKEKPHRKSILEGVSKSLPALMRAHQIQDRASRVGFDWKHIEEVFAKFEEEWRELRDARAEQNQQKIEEEMGDLLFALVNIARYIHVDPEQALQKTNEKFSRRFFHIEQQMALRNQKLEESSLEEMDALWDEAKQLERQEK